MLYDKRWDAKIEEKADPLSLEAFIAWLRQQPGDGVYCYGDSGHCLAAEYNKSFERPYKVVRIWTDSSQPPSESSFDYILEKIAVRFPNTFKGALERAEHIRDTGEWKPFR